MAIIYKLVGIKSNENVNNEMIHKDLSSEKKELNIKDVYTLFSSLGCSEGINEIKFITNSETMKEDKNYTIPEGEGKLIIFVFTMNETLKTKLKEIFNTHGYAAKKEISIVQNSTPQQVYPKVELDKPIAEDEIKIDESTINKSNTETIKLFGEKDFQSLVRIFYENPNVFKTFASYISSGNTIGNLQFSEMRDLEFEKEVEEIKNLNLDIKEESIKTALKKFNGHINLSLRYLLALKSINTNS